MAPNRKLHRDQLVEMLWPEAGGDDALNNLHKVVHAARRVLEPALAQGSASAFLLTQDLQVVLSGPIQIDVEDYERLAASALRGSSAEPLEEARSLYRGDLLEEDIYEDWASVRREQLRLTQQRVLEKLSAAYETALDERALDLSHELLALNRANEDAHRRLMRFFAATGRRHLALAQYRLCCEALQQELDALPEPATTSLYDSLLAGSAAPPAPALPAGSGPLPQPPSLAEGAPVQPPSRKLRFVLAAIALLSAATGAWLWTARMPPGPPPSLAILPLRRTGQSLDHLADGLTEELINSTSRLPGIRVMARGTVFRYLGAPDPRQAGRELKVSAVVSGYVRPEGDAVGVGLEMIDVADGARLWARKYSAPADKLTPLQQLLNTELAAALHNKLPVEPSGSPPRRATQDPAAYRLYLTGRAYWNQRTPEGFGKSIEYYRQAIERDPAYGLAYAGLADSYGLLGFNDALPGDYFPLARAAATKAIALDESLAEAQTSLAMVSALYDWNWVAAEAQFRRAIEMNPGYATAHHWYGVHLGAMGRFSDAARELDTAVGLDPLSPIVNLNRGYPDLYRRRYPQALAAFDKALAINPNFLPAIQDRLFTLKLQGDDAGAAAEAVRYLKLAGSPEIAAQALAASGRDGFIGAAKAWLGVLDRLSRLGYVSPITPARLAVALGDREQAMTWLQRAFEQHSPALVYLAVDPWWDRMRTDGRFRQLLKKIGLPSR